MNLRESAEDIDVPGLFLTVELSMVLVVEGFAALVAFALGVNVMESLGAGLAAERAGIVVFLVSYGLGKTWLNLRLFEKEFRGEIDHFFEWRYYPVVIERPVLKSAVWGGSDPPHRDDSSSGTADPRMLGAAGLGLPLVVLGMLSVTGNPYVVFLIPGIAVAAYYAVRRSGAEPIRPAPYHAGLALTLTYSYLPFVLALVLLFSWTTPSVFSGIFPYSVEYHWGYSPLHRVLLPLTMLPVVYVSNYCLLLAYDSHRPGGSYCPNCGRRADTIDDICPMCEETSTDTTGEPRPGQSDVEASSVKNRMTEKSQTDEYTPWKDRDSAAEMGVPPSQKVETVVDDVFYLIVIAVVAAPMAVFAAGIEPWLVGTLVLAGISGRIVYWKGFPTITSEETETTGDSARTETGGGFREGGQAQLFRAFATLVALPAAVGAWTSGFRPTGVVIAIGVPLVILGVVAIIDDVDLRFLEAGSLAAGTAGGLLGCAIAYAVPFVLAPAGPYRYALWLPVAALVGYVTAMLLYEARESRDRATRR